jgi:hypothetical protein
MPIAVEYAGDMTAFLRCVKNDGLYSSFCLTTSTQYRSVTVYAFHIKKIDFDPFPPPYFGCDGKIR